MQYRREIDGLRTIAVIPVILFHLGINGFSGGFLGVDIFFVISGYLITTNLMNEKENGTFSIINFYDRRARRILPALFFVIVGSIVAGWFIMVPSQLKDFGQSIVAAIGFSSNIYFWLKLDYWSQSSELVPLLHIWSLGIEEQFYVVFPALVLLLVTRSHLKIATVILIIVSYIFMCTTYAAGNVSESFYLLPFRAWELAIGSLAAMYINEVHALTKKFALSLLSVFGAGCVLFSLLFFSESTNITYLHLVPVIGAVILILFATDATVVGRALGNSLFVKIGLISYSLYLTHQPILAFARLYLAAPLNTTSKLVCLMLIVLSAMFSYHFVERPFRDRRKVATKLFYFILVFTGLILGAFGVASHITSGFKEVKLANLPVQESNLIISLENEKNAREQKWNTILTTSDSNFDLDGRNRVLFVGDSISEDLYVAAKLSGQLNEMMELRRLPLDEECIKTRGLSGSGKEYPTCQEEWDSFFNSEVLKEAKIIVLAESWLPSNASFLPNFIDLIRPMNKKLILFNQHQFLDMTSILMGAKKFAYDVNSSASKAYNYNNRHQRTLMANNVIANIAQESNLNIINGFSYFCDQTLKECSLFDDDDTPRLIDIVHFSNTGVIEFSSWFTKELLSALEEYKHHEIGDSKS